MYSKFLLLFMLTHLTTATHHKQENVISIKDGKIMGKTVDLSDFKYNAFLGIPYAKPPIGHLRFKAPEKAEKWEGVLNATEDKAVCLQNDNKNNVIGSEDCLYINVYVPPIKHKFILFPVMVWIYGGGFFFGDSTNKTYNPEYFLRDDVIYVSFNYRLGIFGFISTDDEAASGNYGLKDQILALKWVHDNIERFNGDRNKVTAFGESAGAASVSYLTQMPQTNKLFNRAIMQSAVSLCPWAIGQNIKKYVTEVAQELNLNDNNSYLMIEDLRKIDAVKLQETSMRLLFKNVTERPFIGYLIYAPVIEPNVEGAVITQKSYDLLKTGKFRIIPQLIGYNSQEGGELRSIIKNLKPSIIKENYLIPVNLNQNKSDNDLIISNITKFYFDNGPITEDKFIQLSSDYILVYPINEAVVQLSKHTSVYYYVFSYEGELGNPNRNESGVIHAEDLKYLFKQEAEGTIVNEKDQLIRRKLVKLWTNFAKLASMTPGPGKEMFDNATWLLVNSKPNQLFYMNIGEKLEEKINPFKKSVAFWDFIYKTFGN